MRLDTRAFGVAAGSVAAILYLICAVAVFLAPDATTAVASYLIHMDLSGMPRTLTAEGFIFGLVVWPVGTAAVFAAVAALYNTLLAGRQVNPARKMVHAA